MPLKRETVIIEAGDYDLGGRSAAPNNLQNLRDMQYSLHHILPYRYLLFIGFLAETVHDNFFTRQQNWPTSNRGDELSKNLASLVNVAFRFGSTQQELRTKYAWMAPNLFQGPSGNYRIDDPKSERESVKPQSFPQTVWDALHQAGDRIDKASSWLGGNGYRIRTEKWTIGDYSDLIKELQPLWVRGHGNAHSFNSTDWLVMVSSDVRHKQDFGVPPSDVFKTRFAQHERTNPRAIAYYTPVFTAGAFPPVPVMWRLRKAGEASPQQTIDGPRLQYG